MTGISVVGLLLVAVGAMRGMRAEILADPAYALALLGLAFLANAGFQLVGALLFAGLARPLALTVGLVSGNRNVTLIWAAATPFLAGHPGVELFLAMSVFPIFILPAPTRWLLRRPAWPARRAGRVAQRAGLVLVLAAALGGLGGRIAAAQAVPEPAGPVELFGTGESAGFLSLPARPAPPGGLGVVVLAADQTGPDYRSLRYIARLNAMGIAALELLAYEPDTVDRPDAVAVILAQALVALSADPRVDPQHLGILAFGAAAAAALPGSAAPGHAPVLAAARAALYPGCAGVLDRLGPPPEVPDATPMGADPDAVGRPKPAHGPLLLLHGTVDPANTPSDCAALARRLGRQGPVERLEYAGASYAWDRPGYGAEGPSSLPRPDGAGRVLTAYWPGLADLSAEQVARFFTRAFGPGW
jgi:dienelactone hydrolase